MENKVANEESKRVGKRWLIYLLLFAGIVFSVNTFFIIMAMKTQTGLVSENPYETGLAYNRVLEAAKKSDALGWKAIVITFRKAPLSYDITLQVKDKEGKPVNLTAHEVMLRRPLNAKSDTPLSFQTTGDGTYKTTHLFTEAGQWEINATLRLATDEFHHVQRITVQ